MTFKLHKRILIVEDEVITAMDLQNTLQKMDYEVVGIASTGEDAIKQVNMLKPDIVLMDIILKGDMDGIEATSQIQSLYDVPVIYLTAHSDSKTLKRAKSTKPYGFLTKPVTPGGLEASIETALYNFDLDQKTRQSEEKFRALAENSPDIISRMDSKLRYIYINHGSRTLGLSPDDFIGKKLDEIAPSKKITEIWIEKSEKVLKSGEIQEFEYDFPSIHGLKVYHSYIIPEYDSKGEIVTLLAVSREITLRKKVEDEIKRRSTLLNGINKIFYESITSETVEEVAEKCLEVAQDLTESKFGFLSEIDSNNHLYTLALNSPIWDTHQSSMDIHKLLDTMNMRSYWGRAIKEGKSQINNDPGSDPDRRGLPDGHPLINSFLGVPLKQAGKTIGMIGLANKKEDYSVKDMENVEVLSAAFIEALMRKKAEIKLRESEEKIKISENHYRTIFENTGASTLIVENDTIISLINSEFSKLTGYSKEEIEGIKSWTDFIADNEDLKKMLEYHHLRRKKPDLAPRNYEFKLSDKNNIIKNVYVTASIVPGTNKSVLSMLDITEIKKAEEDKEMLLKEIHHRVKNNLMIISSLLDIQSQDVTDKKAKSFFRESQNRAKSMALIHERLYRSTDLKNINIGEYISSLASELFNAYTTNPDKVKLEIYVEEMRVDINITIPLGLILNELITNSLKYAFPGDREGKLKINFYKIDNELFLNVKDDGIGLPEDFNYRKNDSLGMQLIDSLTEQLSGKLELERENGTEFLITFPETNK